MTILYNTNKNTTQPVYTVNGKPVSVERLAAQGLVELTVVNTDKPPITTEQYLVESWQPDFVKGEYKQVWTVKDYTAYELDVREWGDMSYLFRISAPISLLDPIDPENDLFHKFYNYLMAQGLPDENRGVNKLIWCNEIQPQHVDYIASLEEKGVIIEDRPKSRDFE